MIEGSAADEIQPSKGSLHGVGAFLGVMAAAGAGLLVVLACSSHSTKDSWKLASLQNPQGLNDIINSVRAYGEGKPFCLALILSYIYILMQACTIPGAAIISLIAGAVWGIPALPFVAACNTAGSCLCFFLSRRVLKDWLLKRFVSQISYTTARIQGVSDPFWTLLCLRLNPLVPNGLLNVACPLVDVPFQTFALATLIGVVPLNFMQVNAGRALQPEAGKLQICWLLALSLLPLLASLWQKQRFSYSKDKLLYKKL